MCKVPSSRQTGLLRHEREDMQTTLQKSLERSWTVDLGTSCAHEAVNDVTSRGVRHGRNWPSGDGEVGKAQERVSETLGRAFQLEKGG